jgi:hypothetical protein
MLWAHIPLDAATEQSKTQTGCGSQAVFLMSFQKEFEKQVLAQMLMFLT